MHVRSKLRTACRERPTTEAAVLLDLGVLAIIIIVFAVVVIVAITRCPNTQIPAVIRAFATWIWSPAKQGYGAGPDLTDSSLLFRLGELLPPDAHAVAPPDTPILEPGNAENPQQEPGVSA
jgi:hypothetical protein